MRGQGEGEPGLADVSASREIACHGMLGLSALRSLPMVNHVIYSRFSHWYSQTNRQCHPLQLPTALQFPVQIMYSEDETDMDTSSISDDGAEHPEKEDHLTKEQMENFLDETFPAGSLNVAPYATLKEGFREHEAPGEWAHTLICNYQLRLTNRESLSWRVRLMSKSLSLIIV